jgi:prephenate dehydrogenase
MRISTNLSESVVAIVGLGLMGGSLAMALQGQCKRMLGCDLDPASLDLARKKKLVDSADSNIEVVLPQADLIVLATPVGTILEQLNLIPKFLKGPAVILDLGSTKGEIVNTMEKLPRGLEPIGGHPMCGKEVSGLEYATGDLFHGATFALCAPHMANQDAGILVEELVQAIGAKPLWIEPEIHDAWVGATSHLPYLLSLALVNATPQDAFPLIATGFQSVARLATSEPGMMRDIMLTNQEHVLAAIRRFQSALNDLETAIADGNTEKVKAKFEQSYSRHQRLIMEREAK